MMLPARVIRVGMRRDFNLPRSNNKAEGVEVIVANLNHAPSTPEEVRAMTDRSEQRMTEAGEDWYVLRYRQHLQPEQVEDECCVECTRRLGAETGLGNVCVDCLTWHAYLADPARVDDDTSFTNIVTHDCHNGAYDDCSKVQPLAFFDLTDDLRPHSMCRRCCASQPDEMPETRWIRLQVMWMVRQDKVHPLSAQMPEREMYVDALTAVYYDSQRDG